MNTYKIQKKSHTAVFLAWIIFLAGLFGLAYSVVCLAPVSERQYGDANGTEEYRASRKVQDYAGVIRKEKTEWDVTAFHKKEQISDPKVVLEDVLLDEGLRTRFGKRAEQGSFVRKRAQNVFEKSRWRGPPLSV